MIYRQLGRADVPVSVVSLGTGGQSRLGQATHGDREQSRRVVRRALDLGINLFDTAPSYMSAEEILADALVGIPRADYLLATKVLAVDADGRVDEDEVIASCERSLRQLRSDYVDVFQFHNVGPEEYDAIVEHGLPSALKLKEEGKIRLIGLTERMSGRTGSNAARGAGDPGHQVAARAARDGIWDTIGLKYGILNQAADRDVFPAAVANGVGVLNMSSVRIKLVHPDELEELIRDWKTRGLMPSGALPDQNPLGFLVSEGVPSLLAAAYKFAVGPLAVSTVVVGTGNAEHLEQNVAAVLSGPLSEADVDRLRELFGHITEGV